MKMLDKDPNKRISVAEIFDHPWIEQYRKNKRQKEWGIFAKDDFFEEPNEKESKDENEYSEDYINEEDKITTMIS